MKKFFLLSTVILIGSMALASQFTIVSVSPAASVIGANMITKDFSIQFTFPTNYMGMVSEISFTLENFTSSPIDIVWDSSAYIDPSNNSHRIMHTGVRFISSDKAIPPTVIPPSSKIEDLIFPTDKANWVGGDWIQQPLFFPKPGTTFGVLLSFKINGEVKNYTIRFAVVGAAAGSASSVSPFRAGLSLLAYGRVIYGDSGQITGYQGINWLLGYTAQYYFNKNGMQSNRFNPFWQWGTIGLLIPYIGIGGDYVIPTSKTSDVVLTIGTIYVYPYIGLSFDF